MYKSGEMKKKTQTKMVTIHIPLSCVVSFTIFGGK